MGKLKAGKCVLCDKELHRHDEKRGTVRVARRVYREAHLACIQKGMAEKKLRIDGKKRNG